MPDSSGFYLVPEIVLGFCVLVGAYLYAVSGLNPERPAPVSRWRIAAFATGALAFLVALHPPVDSLAQTSLFSMHMVQHMLISMIGPGLIVAGLPHWLVDPLLRLTPVRSTFAFLTRVPSALAISTAVFWLWHVPSLYQLALQDRVMHDAEHISMALAGVLMWWPVLTTSRRVPRASPPLQLLYLLLLTIPAGFFSALLVFASEPLYPTYELAPRVWPVSALEDQRIGGIIMKLGGVLIFWAVLTVYFLRFMRAAPDGDRAAPRLTH